MSKFNKVVVALCFIVLLFLLGVTIFYISRPKERVVVNTIRDTTYIETRDTIYIPKVYRLPSRIDTVIIFKENKDTLYISGVARDTIDIDSLTFDLKGSITVITDSIIIDKTKYNKFSLDIGAQFSHGVTPNPAFDFGLVLGLNFNDKDKLDIGYYFIEKQVILGYKKRIFNIRKYEIEKK